MLLVKRLAPVSTVATMALRRSTRTKAATVPASDPSTDIKDTLARSKVAKARSGKHAKNVNGTTKSEPDNTAMPPPATPNRKRKHADASTPVQPPLLTPTPSGVALLAAPVESQEEADIASPAEKKARRSRPAEPHMTNAPLRTPQGSRILADPMGAAGAAAETTTTTENLLERAKAHLIAVDPKLAPVVEQHHCQLFSPEGLEEAIDPFRALVSGICGQQVSGAAAKSIRDKFIRLYNEDGVESPIWPTPEQVAATELTRLRTAGLSQRKSEYIQGLAQKFVDGELSAKILAKGSDEELLERLIAVRGLGRWSVEMFLTFALKRMDIFSTGDLGVQRGMAAYVGKDVAKLKAKGGGKWKYMSEQDMLDISAKFSPYRSLFMWYMWRIEDVDIDVMEDT